jgi:hypothetical protein
VGCNASKKRKRSGYTHFRVTSCFHNQGTYELGLS